MTKRSKCRSIPIILLFIYTFFALPLHAYSQSEDSITSELEISYLIDTDGSLKSEYRYFLNNKSDLAIPIKYFQSSIPFSDVKSLKVSVNNDFMIVSTDQFEKYMKFTAALDDVIVPTNSPVEVVVEFKISDHTEDKPSFLSFPTQVSGSTTNSVTAVLPSEFGIPIGSESYDIEQGDTISVTQNDPTGAMFLQFSENIVYKYVQTNYLVNDTDSNSIAEVSIPINNQRQSFLPGVISEKPINYYTDSEDNGFLQFELDPHEELQIQLSGYLLISPDKEIEINTSFPDLTKDILYWEQQLNDPISVGTFDWFEAETEIRDQVIKKIGNKISSILKPITNDRSSQRIGALNIDQNYKGSKQDYVDLTISYLRTYGIPCFQVIGYSDIDEPDKTSFDTWVKVYDPENGWIDIDVFRADIDDTTNYINSKSNSIELLHRGIDSVTPVFITYNLEDIAISSSSSTIKAISLIEIDANDPTISNLTTHFYEKITITNSGNTIIDSYKVVFNGNDLLSNEDAIFPGQSKELELEIDTSLLENERTNKITVLGYPNGYEPVTATTDIKIDAETFWWWEFLRMLISLIIFTILCTIVVVTPKFLKQKNK